MDTVVIKFHRRPQTLMPSLWMDEQRSAALRGAVNISGEGASLSHYGTISEKIIRLLTGSLNVENET